MKVLIVASYNAGRFAPFVVEQAAALQQQGVQLDFFGIQGKGILGYLRNLPLLQQKIASFHPDLIHAHYGLSGLLSTLQHQVPVVITYHGSDLNNPRVRPLSKLAMRRAAWNIRVFGTPSTKPNESILPCGINLPTGQEALPSNVLKDVHKHILFAGAFSNPVKDATLAKQVVATIPNAQLIELKGYSRSEVYALMSACDALLLTSHSEGSPQVIKEAMACGLPIVSINVGDVGHLLDGLDGCYVLQSRDPQELASLLRQALAFTSRTQGRQRIIDLCLTNDRIAANLIAIYNQILSSTNI